MNGTRPRRFGSVSSYVVQHSPVPVLVVRSRKYRDIPDLTSDTVGAAYLGMTAIGKQRKIAIAVDGGGTKNGRGSDVVGLLLAPPPHNTHTHALLRPRRLHSSPSRLTLTAQRLTAV